MKITSNSKFLAAGLFIMAATQITTHYRDIPDFATGLFMGIGIGVMVLAFIRPKQTPVY